MSLSGDMSCVRVDRSQPITIFCCSVRPMFSVMCGLSCSLFMVVGCSHFYVVFVFYSRHLYFYLFYIISKGIFHIGGLVSKMHISVYGLFTEWKCFCFLFFVFCIYCVQSWDYEYSMHTLNILSLNVNGLNSAVKRTRVLEYLHRKSISCALIQETHLKQSDVARFQNKYYKLIAFSCAQNKTKGVLILVNRKLNLTVEHIGSDEKGRFVFIRCKIYNNRLALVSIYGPNETDSAFLTQISKTLLEEIDCPLVVGGDFNAVINPVLDKSQSDTTANPSSKLLNKFITELNLIDLWRIQNTKAKDFTFFSNRHKTFSRIDYIFLSPSLISSNSSISILPILLSDHSAMLCSVPLSDVKAKSPRWRFNISLLSNQTFITSLKEYIKDFLEINMPSDVDPQILWETTKCAYTRFLYIFLFYSRKSENLTSLQQLEIKSNLTNLQKQHFTEQQATQLSSLKDEYDLLSHSKAEFILHRN